MNGWRDGNWLWNPWRQLRELQREMNQLLDGFTPAPTATFPPVNIYADEDGATVVAEVPGVRPEDMDVSAMDRTLTIRGERKPEETQDGEQWHRRERTFGQFARHVELPFTIDPDKVEATCRDGLLKVRLHRVEAEKPRKITVQTA